MVTDVTRDKKTVSQSMFIISDEVVYHTSTNATLTFYTPKSLNNVIREVLLAQFQLFKTEKNYFLHQTSGIIQWPYMHFS